MKNKIIPLITALLALMGFRSCLAVNMYGCPHATFQFQGEATDEDGKPVPGIRVVVSPYGQESDGIQNDTLYTDTQGLAQGTMRYDWPGLPEAMDVVFEDVDGDQNGAFQKAVLKKDQLDMEQTSPGDKSWYEGEYTISAKARLQKQ